MVEPCPRSVQRISRNPKLLGDLVGGGETDDVNVLRQHVRIAPYLLYRLFAVSFEDSYRSAGADAVAVQKQHDLPNLLRLVPRPFDPLPALGADTVNPLQLGASIFNDAQHFRSELLNQLFRQNRPNAF